MKAKTVILLVICGSLLLLVGAFAVFFARGGEVLFWGKMGAGRSGGWIVANEAVAQEIAKLVFTFSPIPQLIIHFQGLGCRPLSQLQDYQNRYIVFGDIKVTGKSLRAFPSKQEYHGMTGEEFWKELTREIQSRISEDSEFHIMTDGSDYLTQTFKEYPERFRHKN